MREWKAAFPKTIPVMAGYVFLGITYGILMVTNGFPVWLPVLTASIVYTGSLEFLLVEMLQSAFDPAAAFATALMVGARHIFYGLAMLPKYRGTGKAKPYLIFALSDETFALNYPAEVPDGMNCSRYYLAVSALDQSYWIAGTALGAFFGSLITVSARGLDFIMTAMFVSIFMDQWLKDSDRIRAQAAAEERRVFWKDRLRAHGSELTGVGGSVLCLLVFGPEHFIVPSMGFVLLALTIFRRPLDPVRGEISVPAAGQTVRDGTSAEPAENEEAAGTRKGGGKA